MVKINFSLLPVKAHYFFFMAGMGPILPFLPVIGKQLGVSEVAMGLIMSVIPILFLFAKPVFGFIVDYFQNQRKTVFITLVIFTTVLFSIIQFIPAYKDTYSQMSCASVQKCLNNSDLGSNFCLIRDESESTLSQKIVLINNSYCSLGELDCSSPEVNFTINCGRLPSEFYHSSTFCLFVVLLSAGSIGYNVANSVSDAICFDVLGEGQEKRYGQQRVWGTMGFGLSALLGGYCIDLWSGPGNYKDYSPAFFIAILFTSIDVLCCSKLKLPDLPRSSNIIKDVMKLVKNPSITTFLIFAAFLGICESFIIFFLFWYLEDLAQTSGSMEHIKLLQGLTVAAETLIGEVIFFPLSGKILAAVGYRQCLSLCFLVYTVRLGLLSLISNPWWALGVELLQGPSYALSYTTVVAYASNISPPGTSATMQGIAAGMDDGFALGGSAAFRVFSAFALVCSISHWLLYVLFVTEGYSVGSLMGGLLYTALGGSAAFRVFSAFALVCSISHWLLYVLFVTEGYSVGSLMGGLLYTALGGSAAFRVFSAFALVCSISHWLLYMMFFKEISSKLASSTQKQGKRNIYNPPKEAAELEAMVS